MHFRKLRPWLILLLMLPFGGAQSAPPKAFRLKNGMNVIVQEDHRSPTAVHMVWYKAGAIDEVSGKTGVAHVLEHMMFKGTQQLKPGEFSRRVAALGGRENAFTGRDYTAYYQQIDSRRLDAVMKLEADRMANLALTDKAFAPEIKVIMEERRWRTDDNAVALLYESLYATAFVSHPYRHPIIGWMHDLENLRAQDARDWYRRWYAPNNATLVVVGDVETKKIRQLAEKHYGRLPAKALPRRHAYEESPQRGTRRTTVKAPADNAHVALAFKVPVLRDVEKDDDVYALEVLEAVLDGYDNARLNARLVRRDRVAIEAGATYQGRARGDGLFILSAVPANGVSTTEAEAALREEVQAIARDGVTAAELQRVKTQLMAAQIYKRDALFEQALEIGSLEMVGVGHEKLPRLIEKLKAVSSHQVQAVAAKYFGEDHMTAATLIPLAVRTHGKEKATP